SATTRNWSASITLMVSRLPFETYTRLPAATMPEGPLPAKFAGENPGPVGINVTTLGALGTPTSITHTEFASRTLGSPRPGTLTGPRAVGRSAPDKDSALGKPKAGKLMPDSAGSFVSAPGIAWYSNMPISLT